VGILDRITRWRSRGVQPVLTREQALQAIPIRNPSLEWSENDDGEVVVVLPRRKDATGKFLAWAFFVPESRPLVLDQVGSFVWNLCDGEHSMASIVSIMCKEYKLNRREVELSLNEYFRMLSKRGMMAVAVPNRILEQLDEKTRRALGVEELRSAEAEGDQPAEQSDAETAEEANEEQE